MTDRPTDGPKDKASYIVAFCNKNMLLLDASPHLYMRVCPSGRGPSVARFFFRIAGFEWGRRKIDGVPIAVRTDGVTCPLTIG